MLPLLVALSFQASGSLHPTFLRTEYLVNPIGLDEVAPRLSWIVESSVRNAKQTAYQILASSTDNASGDLWDTGKVAGDQTTQIEYTGKPLASSERVYWTVRSWDQDGNVSSYTKPSYFETGLMNPSDWKAQWIGMRKSAEDAVSLDGIKWIWYPEGNPSEDAEKNATRLFQHDFEIPDGKKVKKAVVKIAADDHWMVELNGKPPVARGDGFRSFTLVDFTSELKPGKNTILLSATNDAGPAGIVAVVSVMYTDGTSDRFVTDGSWTTTKGPSQNWVQAMVLGELGYRAAPRDSMMGSPSPFMRKAFSVDKPVKSARIYSTAHGLYEVYVDGKKVSNDIFRPGWTDYHKRIQYQTYDVTKQVKQGNHAIGMVVGDGWYCGNVGWNGRQGYGPKPEGLLQLDIEHTDGTHEIVATDASWTAVNGPILNNDLLMGETYDATKEMGGWANSTYKADRWQPVETNEIGTVPLEAQHAQSVEVLDQLKTKAITEPKPGVFVYDLGQNMVGWARLRARGAAGTRITLRFAEMLNPDGTVYTTNLRGAKATDTYTMKGGATETWEPRFTFHGFRYVEVTGFPGKPGKDAITGIVVGSDNPQTGDFSCSSDLVNKLHHNIYWGQRGNYLEAPTDCPQRDERLGWMGDAQIFVRTACYNNDVAAFMTKWTQDVEDAQSPEGGFSDVSPRIGDPNDGAPAWGDAGVIVPWTIYECYGDKRLLARRYESMKKWIEYIDSANPNHLWAKRGNNNFGDWLNVGDDTPRDVLGTSYFAYSTSLVAKSAAVLGHSAEAQHYENLLAKIKDAYSQAYVSADGKIKGDTQTAYVLALRFGLLPDGNRAYAGNRLVEKIMVERKGHLSTGFVGVGYLTPTLTAIGRPDVAYHLLLQDTYPSWGYSIRQGATTIWERWDGWTDTKGFQDPGMNSFNHYSLGSVGEWMGTSVAGIDLASPGYKSIVIHPLPSKEVTWAKGKLKTMHGDIATSWKQTKGRFVLDVTIPANTTAVVVLPAGTLVENDSDESSRSVSGGQSISVGGGTYHFAVATME